jgi:hypothetical protein
MILQKRALRFARKAGPSPQVPRDRRLRNGNPEFQQFGVNARCAPPRVRLRRRADQQADLVGHGRSPEATPTFPGPPRSEASPVPGNDGLRLDDHERRLLSGPGARSERPEPPVHLREAQPPPPSPLQDLQLYEHGRGRATPSSSGKRLRRPARTARTPGPSSALHLFSMIY